MLKTKVLVVVLVVLVVCIYGRYYGKYNQGYHINQTTLDKVSLPLLYERDPIVIYDSIRNPRQLMWTLFKYSYATKREYNISSPEPVQSKAKFSYIFSTDPNGTGIYVNVINPSYAHHFTWDKKTGKSATKLEDTQVEYITIKLRPFQVLIIPSNWIIQTESTVSKIDLDDLFSAIYFRMFA